MRGSEPESSPASCPVDHSSPSGQIWNGLASKPDPKLDPLLPSSSSPPPAPTPPSHANSTRYAYLSTLRERSSIPRTANEKWVYPSEAQFYAAMLRKHTLHSSSAGSASHAEASTTSNAHSPPSPSSPEIVPECPVPHAHPRVGAKKPNPFDMQVVVPIHNAVNERTWIEILKWEDYAPRSQNVENPETCPGGLRLVSFKGDASKLTPRARWRSLIGCVTLLIPFAFLPSLSLYCIFDVFKDALAPEQVPSTL
jgi:cytochrome c heme-lyase